MGAGFGVFCFFVGFSSLGVSLDLGCMTTSLAETCTKVTAWSFIWVFYLCFCLLFF